MNNKEHKDFSMEYKYHILNFEKLNHNKNLVFLRSDIAVLEEKIAKEKKNSERLKNTLESLKNQISDFDLKIYKKYKKYIIAEYNLKYKKQKIQNLNNEVAKLNEYFKKENEKITENEKAIQELQSEINSLKTKEKK